MSSYIYIITCPAYRSFNQYKVGHHTGNVSGLIKRYITSIPELDFVLLLNTEHSIKLEKAVQKEYKEYRVNNCNGNKSELFTVDEVTLKGLISYIMETYMEYASHSAKKKPTRGFFEDEQQIKPSLGKLVLGGPLKKRKIEDEEITSMLSSWNPFQSHNTSPPDSPPRNHRDEEALAKRKKEEALANIQEYIGYLDNRRRAPTLDKPYEQYKKWCISMGHAPAHSNTFRSRMNK